MTDRRPPAVDFDDIPEVFGRRLLGLDRATASWSRTDALRRAEHPQRTRARAGRFNKLNHRTKEPEDGAP